MNSDTVRQAAGAAATTTGSGTGAHSAMSYSANGSGGGRTAAVPPSGCVTIPNTPDVINSILSMTNPFDNFPVVGGGGGGSPASEDSSSGSTCSPVSPARAHNICSSVLVKEELKQAIRLKQKNAMSAGHASPVGHGGGAMAAAAAATASAGSAASSPGGGQAKKRRTDGESSTQGDDDDDDYYDDGDVSSHGEGVSPTSTPIVALP